MKNRLTILTSIRIIIIVLLLWAFDQHSNNYYILLRFLVCGVGTYAAIIAYGSGQKIWIWLLAIISILFNPFVPLNVGRDTWILIDFSVAIILGISVVFVNETNPENGKQKKTEDDALSFILWYSLVTVLLLGLNDMLFFIPNSWVIYDEDGEFVHKAKPLIELTLSGIIAFSVLNFYKKINNENRNLKKSVKVLRCKDKTLITKLSTSHIDTYDPEVDIPLYLILKQTKEIYSYYDKDTFKFLADVTDDSLYRYTCELEKMILDNLPDRIKEKYDELENRLCVRHRRYSSKG